MLLLLLLAVCAWDARAGWFPVAAISVIFGVSLVFLPFLMRQVPLPEKWRCHKALVYFTLETALLLLLELVCSFESRIFWFFLPGLPITLYLAALPWAVMLLVRYVPIRGWFKAAGCCGLLALYHAATPAVVERILVLSGEEMGRPLAVSLVHLPAGGLEHSLGHRQQRQRPDLPGLVVWRRCTWWWASCGGGGNQKSGKQGPLLPLSILPRCR